MSPSNNETTSFYTRGASWFIDLPGYLEQGGTKGDLEMVSGADTMLDVIAGDSNEVVLLIDTQPFDGEDELQLTELCDPVLGGGYYRLPSFEGREILQDMWLCEVTRFVFNDLPPKIYIKRANNG